MIRAISSFAWVDGCEIVLLLLQPEHGADARAKLGHVHRLAEELVCAGIQPTRYVERIVQRTDKQNGRGAVLRHLAEPPAYLDSADVGQHHVQQNDHRSRIERHAKRLHAGSGQADIEPLHMQHVGQQSAHGLFIITDQKPSRVGHGRANLDGLWETSLRERTWPCGEGHR